MKTVQLLIIFIVLYASNAFLYQVKQTVKAKGRLLCGTAPAANVLVKLVDKDLAGPDDEMGRAKTNANGEFEFNGTTAEMGNIEPYIKIYHDCNDAATPCQRKTKLRIPDKFISRGNATEIADIGAVNLEVELKKEARECNP